MENEGEEAGEEHHHGIGRTLWERFPAESWIKLRVVGGRMEIDPKGLIEIVDEMVKGISASAKAMAVMESDIKETQELAKQAIRKIVQQGEVNKEMGRNPNTLRKQLTTHGAQENEGSTPKASRPSPQRSRTKPKIPVEQSNVDETESRGRPSAMESDEQYDTFTSESMEKSVLKKTNEKLTKLDTKLNKLINTAVREIKNTQSGLNWQLQDVQSKVKNHEEALKTGFVAKNIEILLEGSERCQNDLETLGQAIEKIQETKSDKLDTLTLNDNIQDIEASQKEMIGGLSTVKKHMSKIEVVEKSIDQTKLRQQELLKYTKGELSEFRQFTSAKIADVYRELKEKAEAVEVRKKFEGVNDILRILEKDVNCVLAYMPQAQQTQKQKIRKIDRQMGKMEEAFHSLQEQYSERNQVGVCYSIRNMMGDAPSRFEDIRQAHTRHQLTKMPAIADESKKQKIPQEKEQNIGSASKRVLAECPLEEQSAKENTDVVDKNAPEASPLSTVSDLKSVLEGTSYGHLALAKSSPKAASVVPKTPTGPKPKVGTQVAMHTGTLATELVDFMPVVSMARVLTIPRTKHYKLPPKAGDS